MAIGQDSTIASRRALLTGGAAAIIGAGSTGVLASATHDPVIELAARATAAERAWLDADQRWEDLKEVYRDLKPAPPETLFRNPRIDFDLRGAETIQHGDGRWWYGKRRSIARLRATKQVKQDWANCERMPEGVLCGYAPDPKAQARADEIVAAWDTWSRACADIEMRIDLPVAEERARSLFEAYEDLRDELLHTSATTVAGVRAKACVGSGLFDPGVEFQDAEDETDAIRIALSVTRDLLAIVGVTAA